MALDYFKELPGKLDKVEEHAGHVGRRADDYACQIIELLKDINNSTANRVDEWVTYPLTFDVAGTKQIDPRLGYVYIIDRIAYIAPGAADIDVYVGTVDNAGFRLRQSFTGAGRGAVRENIPIAEGQSIFVVSSGAASVNLVVRRLEL